MRITEVASHHVSIWSGHRECFVALLGKETVAWICHKARVHGCRCCGEGHEHAWTSGILWGTPMQEISAREVRSGSCVLSPSVYIGGAVVPFTGGFQQRCSSETWRSHKGHSLSGMWLYVTLAMTWTSRARSLTEDVADARQRKRVRPEHPHVRQDRNFSRLTGA